MGEVITIVNKTVVIGKIMTSVSLSACLIKNDRRGLLIDLDLQRHLTKAFGYRNMNVACYCINY